MEGMEKRDAACETKWRGMNMSSAIQQAGALRNESRPTTLEAAGRIALPMVCFASRRLALLATPPSDFASECLTVALAEFTALVPQKLVLTVEWDCNEMAKMIDGFNYFFC